MASTYTALALLFLSHTFAYPWVARLPGIDTSKLHLGRAKRDDPNCPYNPNHEPAVGITDEFPYLGAKDGLPGTGRGGIIVPAPGDTAHEFRAPREGVDIRGPCPGTNAMANHGFIARDGITNFNELMDGQQNMYNVGYDIALGLALAGVGLDGDLLGTEKVSIGCDATSRTAGLVGSILGDELGYNGHNHFEADSSLSRNDYFTSNGNNYGMNTTLFTEMMSYCNGNCNREALGNYRYQRYQESRAENGNFFFGPLQVLLYGAATFLYELFPTDGGTADEETMMSFFGISKSSAGEYEQNPGEKIPPNWRNRASPYTLLSVGEEILAMYLQHPVQFGGNLGAGNFNGLNSTGYLENGELLEKSGPALLCLVYQQLTSQINSEVGVVSELPVELSNKLVAGFVPWVKDLGCPDNYNSGGGSD